MRGPVAAVVLAMTMATAACSGSSSKATKASTTTVAIATTSTSALSSTTTAGSTSPVSAAPTQPTAHLVAVRAARQGTSDRVVFEFSDRVPGYKIAYTSERLSDTAGRQVTVTGSATLLVRMESAGGFNLDTGKPTYTGPKQVQPTGTQAVQQLAQVDDFEGVLRWAIGVRGQVGFKVSTLTSPARLVIEVGS